MTAARAQHFLTYNAIGYLSKAANIGVALLVVGQFSARDLGLFFLYTNYAIVVTRFGYLGLDKVNIVVGLEDRARSSVLSSILLVKTVISASFMVAMLLFAESMQSVALFGLLLLNYDAAGYVTVMSSTFDQRDQFRTKMAVALFMNASAAAAITVQTIGFANHSVGVLATIMLSCKIATLALIVWVQRISPSIRATSMSTVKVILRNGMRMLAISLSIAVYTRIGIILLPRMGVDLESIGSYGKVVRVVESVGFVAAQIVTYFFPRFIGRRTIEDLKRRLLEVTLLQFVGGLTIVVGFLTWKPFIVERLLKIGPEDALPGGLYEVAILTVLVSFQSYSLLQFLIARLEFRRAQGAFALAAAISVLANAILIHERGTFGAAVASLFTELIVAALLGASVIGWIRSAKVARDGLVVRPEA